MVLTDDEEISQLNARYRRRDRTTDVLSFPMQEGEGAGLHPAILGDVLISVPQAGRQAPGGDLEAEIVRLLIHGLCHLLGLDHDTAARARRMRAEEGRLLGVVGAPTMYKFGRL